ncbi:MAG: YIP1 family protein, partial [Lachnospiraceae bacterium]|nr:YIP1 family protein [Lachnospiraceae bacterium]
MSSALRYSKLGMDYATYDDVHQEQITNFVKNNFIWLFLILLLVIAALVVVLLKMRKRETPFIRNEKIHCFLSTMIHTFQSFHDVKYKKCGSMKIAVAVTVGLLLSAILKHTCCGFLFRTSDAHSYNALFTVAQTAGLLVLWSVANWAICSIMEGKGRLKEVYIVSAYSIIPLILYNVIYLVLSHVVAVEHVDAIVGFRVIVLIYTFYILCVGIMTVHEYNFPKFLWTSIVAVLIMALVVFIGFIIVILIQQLGNFLYSLFMEVVYR